MQEIWFNSTKRGQQRRRRGGILRRRGGQQRIATGTTSQSNPSAKVEDKGKLTATALVAAAATEETALEARDAAEEAALSKESLVESTESG